MLISCGHVQNWPEDENNGVEFHYLCGNVDHSGALEEAGVCEADAIIIGPAEDLPDNEVCAQAGFNQSTKKAIQGLRVGRTGCGGARAGGGGVACTPFAVMSSEC